MEKLLENRPLSLKGFNATIGIVLLEGLLLSALITKSLGAFFATWNVWVLMIAYFIISIIGIVISRKSDRPAMSLLGYNLVVVPAGAVLSVALRGIKPDLIIHALLITAGVVVIMIIAAQLMPDVFIRLGKALFIALIAVIVIEIIAALAGWFRASWWDAIVAGIFALYIGYDWSKAQRSELTLDGAIDSCVDLYLDILNLFLRVLGVLDRDD